MDKQGNKRVHKDEPSTSHAPTKKKKTHSIKQKMDTGNKRSHEHETPCTSHGTPQSLKQHCPSPEKMGDVMRNIRSAKETMTKVKFKLKNEFENDSTKMLTQYIRDSISKLDESIKKTTVGVLGKTGAGKSSLINAVLGESDLLPSGTIFACTSVIIQVEANVTDSNYIAEIEFISKEEWKNELETLLKVLFEDDEKEHAMISTAKSKITALYGQKGVSMTKEKLMNDERFSEIPEFLTSTTKKITCTTGMELSETIACYVQHENTSRGRCYWPVVKTVTIKVPNCKDFLEHVVVVDLPGTGDYNKSRDQMWRSKLRDCSTVWIVSEINRAGSEKEAWDILYTSVIDMAQGGECSSMSFICTKSDDINPQSYMRNAKLKDENFHIISEDPQYTNKRKIACIKHRNSIAKKSVMKNFNQHTIKKHFNCHETFLSVFTVSSEEFNKKPKENPLLKPEDTEIPKLRNLLREYNNTHINGKANLYISGALGILSLIKSCKDINTVKGERLNLYKKLKTNLQNADEHLHDYYMHVYHSLREHLSNGASKCERKCVKNAETMIVKKDGRGFHRTLTALCKNDGFYRSTIGELDLNRCLVKNMYNHIDEEFSEFFQGLQGNVTEKSLQANIEKVTVIPDDLLHEYENSPVLSHMLKFLKTKEKILKEKLKPHILQQKKKIYASLAEHIKTTMQPGYQRADEESGTGSMKRKQDILREHIESSKHTVFKDAMENMLKTFEDEMNATFMMMKTELQQAIEYSLYYLPHMDVSEEIRELTKLITHVYD